MFGLRSRVANLKQEREVCAFAKYLSGMRDKDRELLIHVAVKMANRT
jgi:hypothetical protein